MRTVDALRGSQYVAELDVAVWIDDHGRLRRPAQFLAHHGAVRRLLLAAALPVLAVVATCWAVREASRVILRAHEVAGEGTVPCPACVTGEADDLAGRNQLTYEDVCHAWDLGDAL